MAKEERRQPELRFKGFTADWEQQKINDVALINPNTSVPDEFEYVDLESVVGTEMISYRTIKRIDAPSRAKRLAKIGDVFFQTVRPYQKNNYHFDLQNDNFVFSTGYAQLRPVGDSYFLFSRLQEDKFVLNVLNMCTGTSYPAINANDLGEIKIFFPKNLKEEIKIGSFLRNLDLLIALHQRKLDRLKNLKKAYLQQMFPKKFHSVPKLRFKNFSKVWDQRKLSEITERVSGNDGRMSLPTLTISASSGWLDQRERFSGNIAGKEQKNYTLLSHGELSYNKGNSKIAQYGVVFVLNNYKEALVPRVYHSFKVNEYSVPYFIQYLFETKLPDRELRKIISSGARMDGLLNISYSDFIDINVSIPVVKEQSKISSFLQKFNKNINYHQRKINSLKELKNSYLQLLFI